ncbi:hypothetical protein HKX48_005247 [Thoreauomyces humboldtii]|nr:hypothetical protein HKX48_005247 [Thoreauomyces humboldtii]
MRISVTLLALAGFPLGARADVSTCSRLCVAGAITAGTPFKLFAYTGNFPNPSDSWTIALYEGNLAGSDTTAFEAPCAPPQTLVQSWTSDLTWTAASTTVTAVNITITQSAVLTRAVAAGASYFFQVKDGNVCTIGPYDDPVAVKIVLPASSSSLIPASTISPPVSSATPVAAPAAVPVPIAPSVPADPRAAAGTPVTRTSSRSISVAAVAGIAVAAAAVVLALLLCAFCYRRRRQQCAYGVEGGRSKSIPSSAAAPAESASLARLVSGSGAASESARLRAVTPESGTDEIRVGSVGSSAPTMENLAALEPFAAASLSVNRGLAPQHPVMTPTQSPSASEAGITSAAQGPVDPFADPASPPQKNRRSILAAVSTVGGHSDADSEMQDMATLIANAYRRGLSDEQMTWHPEMGLKHVEGHREVAHVPSRENSHSEAADPGSSAAHLP